MAGFLAVDNYEANAHTYVYDANRSLKGMTVRFQIENKQGSLKVQASLEKRLFKCFPIFQMEALPSVSNYQQDLANLGKMQRPTIEELKAGSVAKAVEVSLIKEVNEIHQ